MLAPIGYEALTGGRISIGTPFFNAFFVPLGLLLLAALAFTRAQLERTRTSVAWCLSSHGCRSGARSVCLVCAGSRVYRRGQRFLSAWVVLTHAKQLFLRIKAWRASCGILSRPGALWLCHGHLGHCGHGDPIYRNRRSNDAAAEVELAGQQVTFTGVIDVLGPNYSAQQGIFILTEADGSNAYELRPEKRQYFAGGNVMTEAGIAAGFFADTYLSLGELWREGLGRCDCITNR